MKVAQCCLNNCDDPHHPSIHPPTHPSTHPPTHPQVTLPPTAGLDGSPIDISGDVTIDSWYAGPRCFAMEPVFVPRTTRAATTASDTTSNYAPPSEDDGWLLCTVYDAAAGRGTLCIFDAARPLGGGPVARIRLPHHLPSGLHGSWAEGIFNGDKGEGAGAAPKWREPTRIRAL